MQTSVRSQWQCNCPNVNQTAVCHYCRATTIHFEASVNVRNIFHVQPGCFTQNHKCEPYGRAGISKIFGFIISSFVDISSSISATQSKSCLDIQPPNRLTDRLADQHSHPRSCECGSRCQMFAASNFSDVCFCWVCTKYLWVRDCLLDKINNFKTVFPGIKISWCAFPPISTYIIDPTVNG